MPREQGYTNAHRAAGPGEISELDATGAGSFWFSRVISQKTRYAMDLHCGRLLVPLHSFHLCRSSAPVARRGQYYNSYPDHIARALVVEILVDRGHNNVRLGQNIGSLSLPSGKISTCVPVAAEDASKSALHGAFQLVDFLP